jgi:hypothetical protein
MYELIQTPRSQPVITPEQLSAFGRFDLPQKYVYGSSPAVYTDDYALLLLMIEAATDEVETMAATACLNEQVLLTFDCFPGQQDPRYHIYHANSPWWWHGFRTKESVELVRRPVIIPSGSPVTNNVVVTYYDPTGTAQTLSPSTYTVYADKITLNVGSYWPVTDRRDDCVQVSYWAGFDPSNPANVPARLQMAIMYLANHFYNVRQIVTVEETTEVGMTLCRMLSSFRSMRIPR